MNELRKSYEYFIYKLEQKQPPVKSAPCVAGFCCAGAAEVGDCLPCVSAMLKNGIRMVIGFTQLINVQANSGQKTKTQCVKACFKAIAHNGPVYEQ